MTAIRNICVARGITTTVGQIYVYTVPDANVFILKSMYLFEENGEASSIWGQLIASDGATSVQVGAFTSPNPRNFSWTGWTVLNAGDRIGFYLNASAWSYWIAGAVLPFAL